MTTRKLAEFTSHITYEDLSEKTIRKTKQCILDWLGISIRGAQEKSAGIIRNTMLEMGGKKEATIFDGINEKTTALNAALCNSAASHAIDFDDLHNPSIIHLACVVVPPVFALAQSEHKSGKEMLAAVVAGYEAGARAGEAVIPESYFFWHTTGTAGIFGSGAAAARILGLNEKQTLSCFGSSGTQAAGLWEFLKEGAMSKILHTGKACYGGILSAYLARNGFTAASKILEGEKGFCKAMVHEPHLKKLTENLGQGYKIDENSFKPYACCKHSHAALYATQTLMKKQKLTIKNVKSIDIYVNDITNYLINNPEPKNPYGCKFSLQYCVAGMFKYGKMGFAEFSKEAISDPEVRNLMKKIHVIRDEDMEKVHNLDPSKLASKVVVHTMDNQEYALEVDYPKGDPPNPMTWEETVEKFMSLAEPIYGKDVCNNILLLIDKLEEVEDFDVALEWAFKPKSPFLKAV